MTDIEMRRISGGTVTLHDARRKVERTVDVEDFEIGVFPITEEQFAEVLPIPSRHPRRPAADLSWLRAVHFCNAASEWEGLDPVYRFDGEDVSWDVTGDGYRLPTESEWEYACRAGSSGPHYAPLADSAWTNADGVSTPQDVGGKLPNLHGLFDTLGNVWEWCWDLLDPARYDDYRVFRGGGFADDSWSVRASVRRGGAPRMHHEDVGLRVARGAFDTPGQAQGWSDRADRERAAFDGPVPFGWTPLRRAGR
ncbi:SUMF1/EgtB/PvdO family nonheme iron enzyme [Microbacterium sp. LWH13-1.2]|uniref:formylglycine-generating enzyme family protein n=1 Tax=Microbacterium sp. LWH13-1.2 TaxID=3135260 RepID=UPI003139F7E9